MPGARAKRKARRIAMTERQETDRQRAKRRREEYVRKVSFTGNVHMPFWDDDHYHAAMRYIETGIESLKSQFPSKVRR